MQNRSPGVRGLVFGGIMAALVVVCALVPFLTLFMPIPLVLAYVRYGGRVAGLTGAVAVIFSAMIVGPVQAFAYLVPAGILPGLAFGYGFRNKMKPLTIGIISVVVFFLGYSLGYVITRTVVLNGRDPIAEMAQSPEVHQIINPMLDAAEKSYRTLPATTPAQKQQLDTLLAQLGEMRSNLTGVFWAILPGGLFLAGAFVTWLNYMLCRWILPRFGHDVPRPTPFVEFSLPAWLTWIFALAMFGQSYMTSTLVSAPWWLKVVNNVFTPLLMIFALNGLAVAVGFAKKKQIALPLAVAGIVLAMMMLGPGLGLQILLFVAIWDSIFDFRGLGHGLWRRAETP